MWTRAYCDAYPKTSKIKKSLRMFVYIWVNSSKIETKQASYNWITFVQKAQQKDTSICNQNSQNLAAAKNFNGQKVFAIIGLNESSQIEYITIQKNCIGTCMITDRVKFEWTLIELETSFDLMKQCSNLFVMFIESNSNKVLTNRLSTNLVCFSIVSTICHWTTKNGGGSICLSEAPYPLTHTPWILSEIEKFQLIWGWSI